MLRTSRIDLILGMDWLMRHRAVIHCKEKVVVLPTPNGDKISVNVVVQAQLTATVNQLNDGANQQECVVEEFPDVFPDDLPGMHLTMTLSLLLNYYQELHP